MPSPQSANWLNTLVDVEQAIAGCLESLSRYEARFHQLLGGVEPLKLQPILVKVNQTGTDPGLLPPSYQDVLQLETLLQEQERVWREWQESLQQWQRSVEQAEEQPPA